MSSDANLTSAVSSLTLVGLAQLYEHRWHFFLMFSTCYVFMLFADILIVYIICSQPRFRRPMFVFVAAVLINSLAGSLAFYPKLLSDLASGQRFVEISRIACLGQAFVVFSVGGSSFMLLSAMAFDRYLSICRPLHYSTLMTPLMVGGLLLLCWLLPMCVVGGAVLLASRVPLCGSQVSRIYCDIYSFVFISCPGRAAMLMQAYGLLGGAVTVLAPVLFVLFSYSRILFISMRGTKGLNLRSLNTCIPHLLVFTNYAVSTGVELLQRRLQTGGETNQILASVLIFLIPNLCNPIVYGLKMKDVYTQVKRLLCSCKEVE
ncbi:olfactory receptor 6N1-like [Cynoglossus semilaevis]|uniref:olfactory receptor 6N1-like n=1 Tax=Cynoglossus semilaevis TaxID=244447 RepID=UPI0004956490|nr:olfactory receptor 6N1-like [Cynoglossus semilaevis]